MDKKRKKHTHYPVFLSASPSVSGIATLLHELWRRKQRQISLHEYKFCVLWLFLEVTQILN
jgi:hypothetical protein